MAFMPLELISPLKVHKIENFFGFDFEICIHLPSFFGHRLHSYPLHDFSAAGFDFHPYPLPRFFLLLEFDPYSPDSQCGAKSSTVTQREKRLIEMEGRLSLSLC
jgi:hypothetical protein